MTVTLQERREPLSCLVLAAGKGVRMRSKRPKVLHEIGGLSLIGHVAATVQRLRPERFAIVLGSQMDEVASAAKPALPIIQDPPLGTGHAVLCARDALAGVKGTVLIVLGDAPLITAETLTRLVAAREEGAAVAVLGFRPADPAHYGRLICSENGQLQSIVEYKDASETERRIGFCNAGTMAVDADALFGLLDETGPHNAQKEYYLTDIVAAARRKNLRTVAIEADAGEVLGVNSRADLAAAEEALQKRLRAAAMEQGATLIDPSTVYFSYDTKLGADVVVGPNVIFGPGVIVADGVLINAFCHIEGASIASGAIVGPFARLRPGAKLERNVHIGNFVEIKKAVMEEGAKANHLAYIGDARVGANSNIGAGTITCNYDGFDKHFTDIGKGVFIGSNSSLVAPVKIGDESYIGAGSVVTQEVEPDSLVLGRGRQTAREGWAKSFRARKMREKKERH